MLKKTFRIFTIFLLSFSILIPTTFSHIGSDYGNHLEIKSVKPNNDLLELRNIISKDLEVIEVQKKQKSKIYRKEDSIIQDPLINLKLNITLDNFYIEGDSFAPLGIDQSLAVPFLISNFDKYSKSFETHEELGSIYREYNNKKTLLDAIDSNLNSQKEIIDTVFIDSISRDKNIQNLKDMLVFYWSKDVGELSVLLEKDSKTVNDNLDEIYNSNQKLADQINFYEVDKITNNTYISYNDSIFVHFEFGDSDVLLIGKLTKKDGERYGIIFEKGYLNGFDVPVEILTNMYLMDQTLFFKLK